MKSIHGFLLILITTNQLCMADISNDEFERFLDEDISFQSVDSLSNKLDIHDQKYKKYTPKEFIRKGLTTPKKLYAVLLKKSTLHKINSDKVISNSEEIYVYAREILYGGQWSYIYNKDNKIKYKTRTKNLAFLEEVIKLRSTIPGNELYPKKSRYHTVDQTIPLEMHLLLRSETTDFKSLNIFTADELEVANSNSISIKSYFNSLLPVDFGLVIDYQSGNVESVSNSILWNSISIGPTIKYDFYNFENFSINTQFAVKKSLVFNVSTEDENAQLSSLSWQLGIEAVYHTKYGGLSLGADTSFIKTSVKGELQNQASFSNSKESINQNAITVGYQYTWML